MAIVTTRSTTLAQTLSIDPALLQTPAAQRARQKGILLAKQQALRAAAGLLAWGRLLTWAICFVSALHIWETVAAIAPPAVTPLKLHAAVYHGAALAFTLLIDACAIYIAKANATSAFAGAPPSRWTLFFYTVTALLNAAFVARYAPAIDPATQKQLLPLLAGLFVGLLPLSIPAGIVAVETANRTLEATRLTLLVEVTILRELHDANADAGVAATNDDRVPALRLPNTAETSVDTDGVAARSAPERAERRYTCKRCGLGSLTFTELGNHSRRCTPVSTPATDKSALT